MASLLAFCSRMAARKCCLHLFVLKPVPGKQESNWMSCAFNIVVCAQKSPIHRRQTANPLQLPWMGGQCLRPLLGKASAMKSYCHCGCKVVGLVRWVCQIWCTQLCLVGKWYARPRTRQAAACGCVHCPDSYEALGDTIQWAHYHWVPYEAKVAWQQWHRKQDMDKEQEWKETIRGT